MKPQNFDRAMDLLRRHSYGDVAEYCETLRENNRFSGNPGPDEYLEVVR